MKEESIGWMERRSEWKEGVSELVNGGRSGCMKD